jgi:hypothetical protein
MLDAMRDTPSSVSPSGRRAFLVGAGAGAGVLLGRGLGVPRWLGREAPPAYETTLRALAATLTPRQRELIVFPADHPSRQIANTISVLERPHLGTLLSSEQRLLVEDLYLSTLSPRGRDAFAGTVAVEGRLDGCMLAIYGEPVDGRAQSVIMGGHLMLRGGGEGAGGAAFGGGIAYGHQVGNGRWRVDGNSFAYHGDAANRLFARLSADERTRAIMADPPHELVLQVQDERGSFPGARIGSLSEAARNEAARLLETVFSCYPAADRGRALSCIDANGGLDALHVAYYASRGFYEGMVAYDSLDAAERARRGDPYWQVWRLEGPGTIVHFKGYPHVHAYIQVVRDPSRANVGEPLGAIRTAMEGEPLRRLIEAALRRATGEDLAFYGPEVPGRFCPGEITTGLAYALDPYRNHVVVATIEGRAMGGELRDRLQAAGTPIAPTARYRVATTDYFGGLPDSFGRPQEIESAGTPLREALVAHLRADGVPASA